MKRFRRAVSYAQTLQGYVQEHSALLLDAAHFRTKKQLLRDKAEKQAPPKITAASLQKEVDGYLASMQSMLAFEAKNWKEALQHSKDAM